MLTPYSFYQTSKIQQIDIGTEYHDFSHRCRTNHYLLLCIYNINSLNRIIIENFNANHIIYIIYTQLIRQT